MFHSLVDSVPVGHLQNKSISRSSLKRSPRVDNFVQNHYRSFILTLKPRHLVYSVNQLWIHRTSFLTDFKKKQQEVEQVLSQCRSNTITNWLTAMNFYTQYMFTCLISFVAEALTTFLVTARKRSLGQGHIFSGVRLSTEGSLCMISLPVWLPGPMFLLGGLPTGEGSCFQRVSIQGLPQGSLPPGGSAFRGTPPPQSEKWAVCILLGMLSCLARIFAGWKFGHLQQEWIHGNTGSTFLWKILVN